MRWLRGLLHHGVVVHGQIVLCPGVNNAAVLDRTCAEIVARYRSLASVGIVPLGVSRYSTAASLRPHDPATAAADVDVIETWQERALETIGRRLFQASDELYLMAGRELPSTATYEGFPQHENGIGMIRAFHDEIERMEAGGHTGSPVVTGEWRTIAAAPATGYRAPNVSNRRPQVAGSDPVVLVTGEYGARALAPVLSRLGALAGRRLRILEVANEFFGGNVAVAGLLVGDDVGRAVRADPGPAAAYLIPDVALKGDVFLDDVTLAAAGQGAKAPLIPVAPSAEALVTALAP